MTDKGHSGEGLVLAHGLCRDKSIMVGKAWPPVLCVSEATDVEKERKQEVSPGYEHQGLLSVTHFLQ